MREFLSLPKSTKLVYRFLFLLVLPLGSFVANAQVTTLQNWSLLYHDTSTSQQTISYTVPSGSNSNRILAVAIASSRTAVGTRTVSISYGGRNLTLANGDMNSSTPRQHTAIYYLNESGLDLAGNSNLVFTISGGTTRVTTVWAAVFDYVDQTNPVTDSRNYSSGTNTANPFVFGTALNTNANDQAVLVVSSIRSNNTNPRTITFPTNFTSVDEETWTTTDGVRNAVGNRSIPTSNTSSTCSTSLSGSTLGSMTGVSFKGCVAPTVNAGNALVAICQGGTSAALGGSVGGSATGGTWSSSVSGGTFNPSATNLNATWTPPANYTGTATLTLTSSGGSCGVVTASKTLVVNPIPTAVTASASVTSICSGAPFNLTSSATSNSGTNTTLINENFNGTASGWTTINNSTGGTPASAAWTLRPNGYVRSITYNSNDASQFYLSDSDAQGSGSTTATILQSPSFSTVGLASATLSFFHYYRDFDTTDFANVEISTDGSNWTVLNSYTSTQGASNGFVQATFSLAAYLNQPTVSIRFKYDGVWVYYWAIDNVSVSGTFSTPPAPTYAWTSTPSGFTSSVQNPTGVTQTVATVYTVTATNSFGCTASASTTSVAITPATVGGSVAGSANICAGANSGLLTLSGHTGSIVRWESAVSPFTTWTPIANTNTTYTSGSLTETTRFRAVIQSGDCAQASSSSATITVTAAPSAGTLSGTQSICSNGTTTFSSTVAGGTWTSGNTAVATINNTSGIVTPVAAGTATMTYTVTGTGGCTNATATRTVTVTTAPSAGTLSGTQSICSTGTTTLSSSVSGGAWTSSDVAVATINNTSGVVTPVAAGTATMTYTVTGTGGCANATATRTVTVTAAPAVGTLSGTQSICFNDTTTFSSSVAGGTWTSGNTAVATINNTSGVVTPVAAGTATMTYTVTGTGGCANATATRTVTISPLAVGGSVSGSATICSGANSGVLTLSGHTGTVVRWESSVSPFTTWTPIANTATTYTSGALTQETKFRAVLQSGSCSETFSSEATLSFSTTTWNGTAWSNGNPAANKTLIIAGNYTSPGATYDLQGCSLTVQNNAVVTIVPQDSVILSGPLTVATGSTMTFEAQAHLIQSGTTNQNSGNVVVKANSSPIKRLDYTLWSAPVAGQQLQAFSPLTLANRFYNYDSNTNFYTVVASPSTSSFEAAKGVLIRVANNHSASQPQVWTGTFTGVPNNGTYTIPLANFGPGKRFTLVGNPYASPIDPEAFITNANNAASITGTLYLWRKTNGSNKPSYCTFNLGGFITNGEPRANEVANLPYQVIQTGQGFFVEGTGAGSGNVVFDNTMRVDDHTNSFLRTANTANTSNSVERNRIWLNVTNTAGAFSQAMIGYVANATNGYDLNYDGKYINDGEIALASILNAEPYAIQCKALPFVATDVIPLQFTATTAGNYSIAIDRVDGLFSAGQNVYLRDNVSGTVHNLTAGAYSFASDSGNFNARFEVLFQSSTLGVNDPVLNENQVVIYKTPTNEISINTGNFVMDNVMIYDLAGRLLYQQKDINNSQALIKVGFATEVLLVKIKTQDGKSVTKKVMFQRTTLKKDLKISTIQLAEDE